MSDGLYKFENVSGHENITGDIKVKKGIFLGENNCYKYQGNFNIEEQELNGYVIIEHKKTKLTEKIPLLAYITDDKNLSLVLPINSKEITFALRKKPNNSLT